MLHTSEGADDRTEGVHGNDGKLRWEGDSMSTELGPALESDGVESLALAC